ncbi:MAG: redoxin domain-containing protein [Prevotella sp.]
MKTRRTVIFALAILVAGVVVAKCATKSGKADDGKKMTLHVTLPDSECDGKYMYLKDVGTRAVLDSAEIRNGAVTFVHEGGIDKFYVVDIRTPRIGYRGCLMAENCELTLDLKPNELGVAQGSPLNQEIQDYEKETAQLRREMKDMTPEQQEATYALLMQKTRQLYNKHTNDAVGAYALMAGGLLESSDPQVIRELLAVMGPNIRNMAPIKEYISMQDAKGRTVAGSMFVDIEGSDEQGNTLKLSQFVGKGNYVLVDMWASWCGPCRREIPNLLQLYRKYHDKGLTIVGVFVWDKLENLKTAKEKEGILWPQLIDSKETATKQYGVNGIPQIILFAPDGTIVERDLRGSKMIEKVDKVMENFTPKKP